MQQIGHNLHDLDIPFIKIARSRQEQLAIDQQHRVPIAACPEHIQYRLLVRTTTNPLAPQ